MQNRIKDQYCNANLGDFTTVKGWFPLYHMNVKYVSIVFVVSIFNFDAFFDLQHPYPQFLL